MSLNNSSEKVRVFITSCEFGEGAWRGHEYQLKNYYELSDKKYILVDEAELADVVIIGSIRQENWGKKALKNELINKYPNKCFSTSNHDNPLILNRGIYESAVRSPLSLGRVCTGSYTLYADKYRNPYIKNHIFSEQDYTKKRYLLSFVGRNSHKIRDNIFNLEFRRKDIFIEDSSKFNLWMQDCEEKLIRQKYYYEILLQSKFSLCPRGNGANSIRLFESMRLGISPIIVSDELIFPVGPKWSDFSIVIKEKHIKELENIVLSHEESFREMGILAKRAFEAYFAEETYFNYVVDNCIDIMNKQFIPESVYWRLNPLIIFCLKLNSVVVPAKLKKILFKR